MTSDTTLKADGICVAFGKRQILHDVDATCNAGRVVAIIGPNGAGKSTLLRALAGLIDVSTGIVKLNGTDLREIETGDVARALAYLPQERRVHWPLAARAVVALGRLPHQGVMAHESRADSAEIATAMRVMDISNMAQRPVSKLSGGELARVLVARALAQDPEVLLADEPTAGLDPAHQLSLFKQFRLMAQSGRCVIIALHDLSMAARFCDEILLLKGGRCLVQGNTAVVLTRDNLAQAYGIDVRLSQVDGEPVILPFEVL